MVSCRAVLLDIDGVLLVAGRPPAGAASAVARLRSAGLPVAFVTNTTSLSRQDITERLRVAGFPADPDEVHTPAAAAARYLALHHPGASCLLLNSGSLGDDLGEVRLVEEGADVVLTGGAGPEIGYAELNRAFRLLIGGARLVTMQRNWSWTTADGPQLDMGAFVVGLEQAAHVEGTLIGKPSPDFYAAVLAQVGVEASEAVMVGDDIDSDVLGAQVVGMRGVLVRTGKFRPEDLERAGGTPDAVVDSVADLPELLGIVD